MVSESTRKRVRVHGNEFRVHENEVRVEGAIRVRESTRKRVRVYGNEFSEVNEDSTDPQPQRNCKEALFCPSRLHFEALILSQSDLKYPCFLFPHFFFAESASRSLKVSCRLDMSH